MWNKLETTYKNNLLILNLFVTFPFFFILLFLSISFSSYFLSNFPEAKQSLGHHLFLLKMKILHFF